MKTRVVVATHNPHKVREIRKIIGRVPFLLKGLDDFPPPYEVREARKAAHHTTCVCMADDTGLEVDSLGGAPGVKSARFAGPKCSYADNNRKLLRCLQKTKRREAQFRCVVAVVFPTGRKKIFEGYCSVCDGNHACCSFKQFSFNMLSGLLYF